MLTRPLKKRRTRLGCNYLNLSSANPLVRRPLIMAGRAYRDWVIDMCISTTPPARAGGVLLSPWRTLFTMMAALTPDQSRVSTPPDRKCVHWCMRDYLRQDRPPPPDLHGRPRPAGRSQGERN